MITYLAIGLFVAAAVKILVWLKKWNGDPELSTLAAFAICWPLIAPYVLYKLLSTGREIAENSIKNAKTRRNKQEG